MIEQFQKKGKVRGELFTLSENNLSHLAGNCEGSIILLNNLQGYRGMYVLGCYDPR